jgi:hypothetical protein
MTNLVAIHLTCRWQMLQPLYTMNGFNWFERRGVEGVGFVRTLRTLLTGNLPQILPDMGLTTKALFAELHERHPEVNGMRMVPSASWSLLLLKIHTAFRGSTLSHIPHDDQARGEAERTRPVWAGVRFVTWNLLLQYMPGANLRPCKPITRSLWRVLCRMSSRRCSLQK